jgi:radical SAM superfamily enzyme YgiQ (UPF0313 family)
MGTKKLLLINPFNSSRMGVAINPNNRFQPLGLGIIAALTPDDWEVALIDENFESFKYQEADLVGLTAFTVNACRAYEIADVYRKSSIPTIMGGIHASMLPEEALRYVNTVVIGEAENVWPKVIADFTTGHMQRIYQGEWQELAGMVWPRRDLFHPKYMFGSIQTSRGCPLDCEFCSVSAFNGRRYRQRPVEEVLDEMETILQKFLFFVDDNLIGYGKEAEKRAIELFKGMIRRKIKKQWFCQASMNFADNEEVLEYATKAGCRIVLIGVEAEDTDALGELGKKLNLKIGVDAYEEAFRRINRHGIAVLGSFMGGMDVDTPEKLRRRTNYAWRSKGINAIEASYLTPFPGTRLFNKLRDEGRLLYNKFPEDWNRYDLTEVVYKPALMTPQELSAIGSEVAQRVCSRRSVWRRFFRNWRATRSFTTAMWAHQVNIAYRDAALLAVSSNKKENE